MSYISSFLLVLEWFSRASKGFYKCLNILLSRRSYNKPFKNFDIQTDLSFMARKPDTANKINWHLKDLVVPTDHIVKMKESEKIVKYIDLARELKTLEHESDGIYNRGWYL